jgi:hypothetical protein
MNNFVTWYYFHLGFKLLLPLSKKILCLSLVKPVFDK